MRRMNVGEKETHAGRPCSMASSRARDGRWGTVIEVVVKSNRQWQQS